jgi:hypothetical protein
LFLVIFLPEFLSFAATRFPALFLPVIPAHIRARFFFCPFFSGNFYSYFLSCLPILKTSKIT